MLARNLTHAIRDLGRAKRDMARERSLDAAMERSSSCLQNWLASDQSSPSQQAEKHEQMLRMAKALEALPDDQHYVVVEHYWKDRSLAEIAGQLGRSEGAVAGLLHRSLKWLRARLKE